MNYVVLHVLNFYLFFYQDVQKQLNIFHFLVFYLDFRISTIAIYLNLIIICSNKIKPVYKSKFKIFWNL